MRDDGTTQGATNEGSGGVERRAVLKAITLGGAVLLVPRGALGEGLTVETADFGSIEAAASYETLKGTVERVRMKGETLPAMDAAGMRFAVDVHRTAAGNVYVQWGTAAGTVGADKTKLTFAIGSGPDKVKVDAAGNQTFNVTLSVKLDKDGNLSVVTPGSDPGA